MVSADDEPFLEAILARRLDDGPRLVYADYLDETGRRGDAARAEFVRTQVALARVPPDHPRRPGLEERQADLLRRHAAEWAAPFADAGAGVEFRRGLPELAIIDAAAFLRRGGELLRRARVGGPGGPSLVRGVRLRDPAPVLPALVACPLLAEIEELDLCQGDLGNGGVNLLVRCPHLGRVRVLDLGFNGLDDAGVRLLARATTLPGLRTARLNDNGAITWDGVAAVARSRAFPRLAHLDLSGNDINDAGVRAVAESAVLGGLRGLAVDRNPIGDSGLGVFVGSGLLGRTLGPDGQLNLRSTGVGPAGATALAAGPALARVCGLDLDKNYLGDRGVAALTATGRLTGVRSLRLSRNQLGDPAAFALAAAIGRMPRLRSLDLTGNRLSWRGEGALRAVAAPRGIALGLSGNGADAPVAVADVVAGILTEVAAAEVAALRRRVAHPARPGP